MRMYWIRLLLLISAIGSIVVACAPATKPTVVIESPASGAQVNKDDEVSIKFSATDANGITRVELIVDGTSVKTDTVPAVGTLVGVQKWKATIGSHTISLRAYNPAGTASDPVSVALNVVQATPTTVPPTATATATTRPTAAPSPTATRLISPTPSAKDNLLASFSAALAKIKVYRAKVILDPSRQDDPYRIIEAILPDRFKQIQPTDIRQVGSKLYFVEGFVTYTTPSLWYAFERVHLPWYRDQIQQAPQAILLGRSVIDSAQLVGYQLTIPFQTTNLSNQFEIVNQPTKIWFSAQTGYPVRIEVGQPIQFINLFYDFNTAIDEIGPP